MGGEHVADDSHAVLFSSSGEIIVNAPAAPVEVVLPVSVVFPARPVPTRYHCT